MDRREMLLGAAAAGTAAWMSNAMAADEHPQHMQHHVGGKYLPLLDSTADCVRTGENCLAHCLIVLGEGDKEMSGCSKSVNQMLSVCNALMRLAAQESSYVPKMAAVAAQVCKDCEDQCRKHEKKHEECKACAEACVACLKECKRVAA